MKRLLWIPLLTLLLAAGCAAPKAGLPNPVVEVDGAEALASLGLAITAPGKAENERYSMISDEIAQIEYEADGLAFTYRAAKTEEDISGVYETFDEETLGLSACGEDWDATVTVKSINGGKGGALAIWFAGDTQYTLFTPGPVRPEDMAQYALRRAEKDYPRENDQ